MLLLLSNSMLFFSHSIRTRNGEYNTVSSFKVLGWFLLTQWCWWRGQLDCQVDWWDRTCKKEKEREQAARIVFTEDTENGGSGCCIYDVHETWSSRGLTRCCTFSSCSVLFRGKEKANEQGMARECTKERNGGRDKPPSYPLLPPTGPWILSKSYSRHHVTVIVTTLFPNCEIRRAVRIYISYDIKTQLVNLKRVLTWSQRPGQRVLA